MFTKQFPHQYFASYASKKRGIATLISKDFPLEVNQIVRDKEGRFLIIKGIAYGEKLTLVNIYAPNDNQKTFYLELFPTIARHMEGITICIGDFNMVMNHTLDKSKALNTTPEESSTILADESNNLGLTDTWRLCFPTKRDFSFYSHPHDSYSRLDYIFISKKATCMVNSAGIGNITTSDHAPIWCTINLKALEPKPMRWRLGHATLDDPTIFEDIHTEIEQYFKNNTVDQTSHSTHWDAFKAVIRGKIIQLSSRLNYSKKMEIERLRQEIHKLEARHKKTGSPKTLTKLIRSRGELDSALSDKVESDILRSRQYYYEKGNKPDKLLAYKLKVRTQASYIHKIKDPLGNVHLMEHEKRACFADYYNKLFSEPPSEIDSLEEYLSSISLPELTEDERESLEKDISIEEILQVIKTLQNLKAPGPDGFGAIFYKKYRHILAKHLSTLFNSFITSKTVTTSMQEAIVSILLKAGKDPEVCASYRPISLLNVDVKMYAKILANRLAKILPRLVHRDQTGFILGRQAADNIRRNIDLIDYANSAGIPTMVLALDAEKAFDRVNWKYLEKILQKFKFGPKFTNLLLANFQDPKAKININGYLSHELHLERGTRQGCPLSPLIFALTMEPFATRIRGNSEIEGLNVGGETYKISMFADDIFLTITNPHSSLIALARELDKYEKASGFKINYSKSEALNIKLDDQTRKEIGNVSLPVGVQEN